MEKRLDFKSFLSHPNPSTMTSRYLLVVCSSRNVFSPLLTPPPLSLEWRHDTFSVVCSPRNIFYPFWLSVSRVTSRYFLRRYLSLGIFIYLLLTIPPCLSSDVTLQCNFYGQEKICTDVKEVEASLCPPPPTLLRSLPPFREGLRIGWTLAVVVDVATPPLHVQSRVKGWGLLVAGQSLANETRPQPISIKTAFTQYRHHYYYYTSYQPRGAITITQTLG